jgi:hypothetical protein
LLTVTVLPGQVAFSDERSSPAPQVLRVEEDWVLVLNQPNDSAISPQFHTAMSPAGNFNNFFAQVVWNYREIPDFRAGGLQLQLWNGQEVVQYKSDREDPLSTAAETIRWTQVLETSDGVLDFHIADGQSVTWGDFGDGLHLASAGGPVDLNGYSPEFSVQNSCITYGANRVNILAISQVRYYGASGLISVDETPRVVYAAVTAD